MLCVEDAALLIANIFIAEHVGKRSLLEAVIKWQAQKLVMWCELNGLTNDAPAPEFLFNLRRTSRQKNFDVLWYDNILMSRLKLHSPRTAFKSACLIIFEEV